MFLIHLASCFNQLFATLQLVDELSAGTLLYFTCSTLIHLCYCYSRYISGINCFSNDNLVHVYHYVQEPTPESVSKLVAAVEQAARSLMTVNQFRYPRAYFYYWGQEYRGIRAVYKTLRQKASYSQRRSLPDLSELDQLLHIKSAFQLDPNVEIERLRLVQAAACGMRIIKFATNEQ